MGTLVAVRKGNEACIAVNAVNLRDPTMKSIHGPNQSCVQKIGEAYIGLHSSAGFQQVFENYLAVYEGKGSPMLTKRSEVYEFFVRAHETLRNQARMFVTFQAGQEFEWTPMNALVVSRNSIFKVDSTRAVYEFDKFWAIGSGEQYALGAMHATYDHHTSCQDIARAALAAARDFESNASEDVQIYSIKTPQLSVAPKIGTTKGEVSKKSKKGLTRVR